MKILLFTDVHADKESLEKILEKSKDCDVMLCCGDISVFGSGLKRTMQTLRKSGKKMFLTHGNHEMITELKDLCDGKLDIFLHKEFVKFEDVTFIAYGGGGFSDFFGGDIFGNTRSSRRRTSGSNLKISIPLYTLKQLEIFPVSLFKSVLFVMIIYFDSSGCAKSMLLYPLFFKYLSAIL